MGVLHDIGVGRLSRDEPPKDVQREPERMRAMRRAFDRALESTCARVRTEHYRFAGRAVRMRAVGTDFADRVHRAFAHLRVEDTNVAPLLTIDVWDETQCDVPGIAEAPATDLERQWIACDGLLTASADGRYVSFRYRDSVTILDRRSQHMIGCRRNGSMLSGGDYSKPLLLMLGIWYNDRGVRLLHAGLIASDGEGVLLPGESGTGKSTTSIAAISSGLEFLGDDFIGLERKSDGTFVGHSVFSTACLVRENYTRFPELRHHAVEERDGGVDKPILFLAEIFPERIRTSVPIRAVLLLRIGFEQTELRPARPAEAMRAFAASTLHTVVPRPGREALEALGGMLESVPAAWLHLGPSLSDIPLSVQRVVGGARGLNGH